MADRLVDMLLLTLRDLARQEGVTLDILRPFVVTIIDLVRRRLHPEGFTDQDIADVLGLGKIS